MNQKSFVALVAHVVKCTVHDENQAAIVLARFQEILCAPLDDDRLEPVKYTVASGIVPVSVNFF